MVFFFQDVSVLIWTGKLWQLLLYRISFQQRLNSFETEPLNCGKMTRRWLILIFRFTFGWCSRLIRVFISTWGLRSKRERIPGVCTHLLQCQRGIRHLYCEHHSIKFCETCWKLTGMNPAKIMLVSHFPKLLKNIYLFYTICSS